MNAKAEARLHIHEASKSSRHEEGGALKDRPFEKLADLIVEEDWLLDDSMAPWAMSQVSGELERALAEAADLEKSCRWEDLLALFHPLAEKAPTLVEMGVVGELRLKVAFALGQVGRFDEAIVTLDPLVREEPDNFRAHAGLAFNAARSLDAVKENRVILTPAMRKERLKLAHTHFQRCREIRPESITAWYREGILFSRTEKKTFKAIPFFERAIANWRALSAQEQAEHHQEWPKYIKSLYNLAKCHLDLGRPSRSLEVLEQVLEEDRDKHVMAPLFKHFAMGKTLFALARPKEAMAHLETAAHSADKNEPLDYVWELAARCCLAMKDMEKARECIGRIPPHQRRHYVRWTEADVLCALGEHDRAVSILTESASRDRRSRHKALLRLARICYGRGEKEKALNHAEEANRFCKATYGNACDDALFWEAACLYRMNRLDEALRRIEELRESDSRLPGLGRLERMIREAPRK